MFITDMICVKSVTVVCAVFKQVLCMFVFWVCSCSVLGLGSGRHEDSPSSRRQQR